jgi:hypothetical protein
MPDCAASIQSGTGLKKIHDVGAGLVQELTIAVQYFFGLVPDRDYGCRNADADVIFLDDIVPLTFKVFFVNFS